MINIKKYIVAFILFLLTCTLLWTTPLAVEFMGIEASIQDLKVVLTWSTATETANLGFILERKTDSLESWESHANYLNDDALVGQGTVSTQSNYTYTDSLVTNGETYFYRISGIDYANNIGLLDSLSILVGEVGIKPMVPSDFILTAYPNPFNPRIAISYSIFAEASMDMQLSASSQIEMNIYNTRGILVKELVSGFVEVGNHKIIWDATGMPSGVYIVTMQAGNTVKSQKIALIK
ncbi:MAG: T9SS type A sorting domain-containing protein [Candidatus Marinimicrobia bacterium]|nr:T9SS type A sorting domain-containing protein [Candidatus Neomarinimicrobiota bacterium]